MNKMMCDYSTYSILKKLTPRFDFTSAADTRRFADQRSSYRSSAAGTASAADSLDHSTPAAGHTPAAAAGSSR